MLVAVAVVTILRVRPIMLVATEAVVMEQWGIYLLQLLALQILVAVEVEVLLAAVKALVKRAAPVS
jgi:hypothetical protein